MSDSVGKRKGGETGLTIVELLIALVVMALLVVLSMIYLRRYQTAAMIAELEALGKAGPHEIFIFEASPLKESFRLEEDVLIFCKITNPTDFALRFPYGSLVLLEEFNAAFVPKQFTWYRVTPLNGEPIVRRYVPSLEREYKPIPPGASVLICFRTSVPAWVNETRRFPFERDYYVSASPLQPGTQASEVPAELPRVTVLIER